MSKTTNYQLTLWDYDDEDFSPKRAREDLAENFARLDQVLAKKVRVVVGYYNSTAEIRVELGAKPLGVHIEDNIGYRYGNYSNGGLFGPDTSFSSAVVFDDTGFTVKSSNLLGTKRIYVAYVEDQ